MPTSTPITDTVLLNQLNWRYATKRFIPNKDIPEAQWQILETAIQLSPSSYGLQPYRFIVIRDQALREQLKTAAYKQPQITDASHLVVFASATDLTEKQVDHFIATTAAIRGIPVTALDGYRATILGDLVNGPRHAFIADWTKRQSYLALGILLSSAAQLGIDACPMEGFNPAEFDRILGLPAKGLASTVLCTLGFRSAEDRHATERKVRFPVAELIEHR
jgi:nitroreductase